MRIVNNNQGILQLFSRMNGNRTNTNKPFGNTALSRRFRQVERNMFIMYVPAIKRIKRCVHHIASQRQT